MSRAPSVIFVALALCAGTAYGQSSTNRPQIGYLYPAGGQQGTAVQVVAGGQFLNGVGAVYVSGDGVSASVVRYIRPLRNLQKEQRDLLQQRLKEVRDTRLAELPGGNRRSLASGRPNRSRANAGTSKPAEKAGDDNAGKVKLPEHPLLFDLDGKSLRELTHVRSVLFFPRQKLQINRQLAEMVLIEVTVDPNAAPGDRELRLATKTALTNPVVFQVGHLPETRELEPNDREATPALPNLPKGVDVPKPPPLDLPVLLNGQIMPGDVDRFRFRARQGQRLVINAQARSLIPYLADAVPGWFQATLALYDALGKEVAYADDYRFDPDPVLFYEIPRDGEYELEIRDSIYRGREDFVYRIAVSDQPFVTETFPLGGRMGVRTSASIAGWNIPETTLALDTSPGRDSLRQTVYHRGKRISNPVLYAVDVLPEFNEAESNDSRDRAQRIDLPKIINGRIAKAGDVDVFSVHGRAGMKIVAEVAARRLNSPLDSLVRVTDASGKVVALNDDHVLKDTHLHKDIVGLVTHHADSHVVAELPRDGTYYVHLADAQNHGGKSYGYRLRLAEAHGDFALRVTPSSISARAGGIVPICVHVLRKDGYDGEIRVMLKNAPTGFELKGGRIPPGRDRVRMTLMAPAKASGAPVALELEGRARVNGQMISRPVVPADDVMQAFLYRHLVPAREFLVAVQKAKWRAPAITLSGHHTVRIPAGGSAQVQLKTRARLPVKEIQLELIDPPEGVTIHDLSAVPGGYTFRLQAEADVLKNGFADNLIVETIRETTPKQQPGKPAPKKRRYSMGFFPAIPIEIVQR